MAELILAIVGIAITIPGIAISFARCGEQIVKLTEHYVSGQKIMREIAFFGKSLHQGKLKLDLEIAEALHRASDVDEFQKLAIEEILSQLANSLVEVAYTLDSFLDTNQQLHRRRFALYGERKIGRSVKRLKEWQTEFESLLDLIDKKRRLVPDQLLLSRDKFRIIHQADSSDYTNIEGSKVYVAHCEYRYNGIHEFRCLIERRTKPEGIEPTEIKAIANILASKLSKNTSTAGILQCIGYRDLNEPELVFKLPENAGVIKTLESVIRSSAGPPSLEERLQLGREMCESVLRVHTSGLVHKNIRSNSVLLVERTVDSQNSKAGPPLRQDLGTVFLTEWHMLRQMSELSSRRGGDDWKEDIYRHPRRQGKQPEVRYHLGHDLYSLGVVLIEIALWETIIQPHQDPPLSSIFRHNVQINKLVPQADLTKLAKLTAPLTVSKALLSIAEREVATRLGSGIAEFVISCLTCLEGGMAGITEQAFKDAPTEIVLKIREMFMQAFPPL